MEHDVYIWRDTIDPNQFWIGTKGKVAYSGWLPVFCDALDDCFGAGTYEQCKGMKGGYPVRIKLTFKFLE